jgi:hypothetical protein
LLEQEIWAAYGHSGARMRAADAWAGERGFGRSSMEVPRMALEAQNFIYPARSRSPDSPSQNGDLL